MSIAMINRVTEHSRAAPAHKCILYILAKYADDETGLAWPSVPTVAAHANVSVRAVRKSLAALLAQGQIAVDGKAPGGVIRYRLTPGPLTGTGARDRNRSASPKTGTPGHPGTAGQVSHGSARGEPEFRKTGTTGPQDRNPSSPNPSRPIKTHHDPSARARGSRLPEGWSLDEVGRAYAHREGLDPAWIEHEAARFANYWHGVSGARGVKRDWPATWRNWVLRAKGGGRPRGLGGSATEGGDALTRAAADYAMAALEAGR